jgi:uncharacterized protein (TIGR00725 family)
VSPAAKHIVTVFGSSVPLVNSAEYGTAYDCGKKIAEAGLTICNGGYRGTMEASAKGAREAGGQTIGVTISDWPRKPNAWIQQEIKTASLIERLMKLVELGNAYIVLPGGTGTLLEFACVLELINKEIINRKPIILVGDFWDGVLNSLGNEPGSEVQARSNRLVHKVQSAVELPEYLKKSFSS